MRIRKLTLWGFTSYKKKITVDFSDMSVFVITGPNGAGKSSLVESILFALYGKTPRMQGNIAPLISQDAKEMGVDLEFYLREDVYRVLRIYKKTGSGKISPVTIEIRKWDGEKWRLVASKSKDVTKEIERLLGMDYSTFTRAVIIPQNMFDKFLKPGKIKDRRDMLITILGLSIYEKIRELAREERTKIENERYKLEVNWEQVKDIEEKDIVQIEEEIRLKSKEEKEKEALSESLLKEIEKLKKLYEKEKELAEVEKELKILLSKKLEFEALDERIKKARDVRELIPKYDYISKLKESYKKKEDIFFKKEKELKIEEASLSKFNKRIEEFLKSSVKTPDEVIEHKERKREIALTILTRIEEIRNVYKDFKSVDSDLKEYTKHLKLKEKAYKKLYDEYKEIVETLKEAKQKEKEYYAIKVSSYLEDGDICPVCGGVYKKSYTKEEKRPLYDIDNLKEKENMLKVKLTKLKGEREKLLEFLSDKKRRQDRNKEILSDFKRYIFEKTGIDISGFTLEKVEELFAKEKRQLENDIKNLRHLQESIATSKEKILILKRDLEEKRKELSSINKELTSEEELFLKELKKKGYETFEEVRVFSLKEEEIDRLEKEREQYNSRLVVLIEKQRDLSLFLKNEKDIEKRLIEAEEGIKFLKEEIKEINISIITLKENLKKMREGIEKKKKIEKEMDVLDKRLGIYNTILQDLQSDRLPDYVLATVMDTLTERASESLNLLSDGRYTLQLDENDDIVVVDVWNGGEVRPVGTLSGGEVFAASLVLAISLRDLVQGKGILDTFFIDEGFGALDKETREKVVDVLGSLSETGKLVGIITHVEELAMNFPIGFRIHKSPQGSEIEVINPVR